MVYTDADSVVMCSVHPSGALLQGPLIQTGISSMHGVE